eukprot:6191146-Pleurochrysis_carterae.AAC.3
MPLFKRASKVLSRKKIRKRQCVAVRMRTSRRLVALTTLHACRHVAPTQLYGHYYACATRACIAQVSLESSQQLARSRQISKILKTATLEEPRNSKLKVLVQQHKLLFMCEQTYHANSCWARTEFERLWLVLAVPRLCKPRRVLSRARQIEAASAKEQLG